MRRTTVLAAAAGLALLAPAAAPAAKKVPAQLAHARYVCLGYDMGQGFLSEQQSIAAAYDVYPEDRQVLNAVHDAIEKWGKYVIALRPEQAELLVAVRAGRRAAAGVGIGGGPGGRGGFGSLGTGRAELSSSEDLFTIYESRGGQVGATLWRQQGRGLFAGSPPKVFAEFRDDVESTPPPPSKPAK